MRTARRGFTAFPTKLQIHMCEAVDDRIAGLTAADALPLFDTITHDDAGPFVRNTDSWLADIVSKLTSISPSNSTEDNERGGVAITPRHIIYAKHTQIADGASVRFVTVDNTPVVRTQSQHKEIGGTFPIAPDFCIGLLSSDLPATITPAKVASDSMLTKVNYWPPVPVLQLDKDENGLVFDVVSLSYGPQGDKSFELQTPLDSTRQDFYQAIISGDSGNPVFLIINGELVLIGVTSGVSVADGSHTVGNCVIGWNDDINEAIEDVDALGGVSTGYTVSNPDLSGF